MADLGYWPGPHRPGEAIYSTDWGWLVYQRHASDGSAIYHQTPSPIPASP